MSGPLEMHLDHPVEVDDKHYDKLTVASFDALVNFRTNSPEQIIRSMALCFNVPRRVIRHLHPDDASRAGDLLCALLDETARPFKAV